MTPISEKACPQCGKGVKPALLKCSECGFRFPLNKPTTDPVAPTNIAKPATTTVTPAPSGPRLVNGKTILSSGPRVIGASRPSAAHSSATSSVPRTVSIAAPVAAAPAQARPAAVSQPVVTPQPAVTRNGAPSKPIAAQQPTASAPSTAPQSEPVATQSRPAEAGDVILVTCECGGSFRVKAEWAGRRRKCTHCSKPVLVPKDDDFDADALAERLALESDVKAAIRQLEAAPQEVTLKKTVSGATLKKLEKQLVVNSVFSEAEAQQRRKAIAELGRSHDVRAIELIQRSLKDDFAIVRIAVAEAVAELADPRGLPLLLQLLMDQEEDVVSEAIRATKSFAEPILVRPLLRSGLSNPIQKLHASEALVRMGKVITQPLQDVVQRRDRGMLLDAVVLLGRLGDEAAVPVLLDALNHTSGPLRAYTLEALGRIGDKRAIGAMIGLLDDPDEVIQVNAMMALERVADARAVKPLLAKLSSDSSEIRCRAMAALGRIGDARACEPIMSMLPTAEGAEKEAILETLCSLGDESAGSVLLPLLAEPVAEQQRQILGWARRVKPSGMIEHLLPVIPIAATAVRRLAADVLGEYADPNSVQALRELAKDLAPDVRGAALKSLAKTAKSQALPQLEQALREEASVRIAAVIAIGIVNDARSLPAMMAMLKDGLPEVRYHAVKAIGKLGAKQAESAIKPLLDDPEEMVKAAAEKAFEDLGLQAPKASLMQSWGKRFNGLLPDIVAGAMPGKTLAMGAAILLAVSGGIWMLTKVSGLTGNDVLAAASSDEVASIAATSNSQIAIWTKQGNVKLLNVDSNKIEKELPLGRSGRFMAHAAEPTVFALIDRKLAAWDVTENTEPPAQADAIPMSNDLPQVSGNGKVAIVRLNADVVTWSLTQHKQMARFAVSSSVRPVITQNGERVIAVARDGVRLVVFSAETGDEMATLHSDALKLRELAVSPDGKQAYVVIENQAFVINIETLAVTKVAENGVIPNPRYIGAETVVGYRGVTVFRLTLPDGKITTWSLDGGEEQISQLVSLADGKKFAAFGTDDNDHGRAWLLDTATGESTEVKP